MHEKVCLVYIPVPKARFSPSSHGVREWLEATVEVASLIMQGQLYHNIGSDFQKLYWNDFRPYPKPNAKEPGRLLNCWVPELMSIKFVHHDEKRRFVAMGHLVPQMNVYIKSPDGDYQSYSPYQQWFDLLEEHKKIS